MLSARQAMDVVSVFRDVGSYRAAGAICGVDPKTVKRKVAAQESGELEQGVTRRRREVARNTDVVRDLVAKRVSDTKATISAKRLLGEARAAGYGGSDRNFRRLVAAEKQAWRMAKSRQRRPAVWVPGETLVIDWGTVGGGVKVFCAVLAWCRVRFVRFARDETAATTFALLAECFETLGGVPAKVLADRMGCLKAGTVAGVVIPTPDYVRFATHYGFSPDFCHPRDPESKGIVEHLVGYAKRDLLAPDTDDLADWNRAAATWCAEVNGREHSEICAIPAERLETERELLRRLPSARPRIGHAELRKVDRLSTIRVASVRYSVPSRLVGQRVEAVIYDGQVRIYTLDGELVAEHVQGTAGEASILDEHYPTPRVAPWRGPRARSDVEKTFLTLGEPAEVFITAGAAAGATMLPKDIARIVTELIPAHGSDAVVKALERAVRFGRFRADDVASILAIGPIPETVDPGEQVVVDLPSVEVRSFDAYRLDHLA